MPHKNYAAVVLLSIGAEKVLGEVVRRRGDACQRPERLVMCSLGRAMM
jgi:hypothetical protein